MDTKTQPTPIFRAKNHKAPRQWVKVMGRLADPKARARIARQLEKDGFPMEEADQFNYYTGFAVDAYGFTGAFEKAEAYIADEMLTYGNTFEWKISGGEW